MDTNEPAVTLAWVDRGLNAHNHGCFIYLQHYAIRTTYSGQIAHGQPHMPHVHGTHQVYASYLCRASRPFLDDFRKQRAFVVVKQVLLRPEPVNRHAGSSFATCIPSTPNGGTHRETSTPSEGEIHHSCHRQKYPPNTALDEFRTCSRCSIRPKTNVLALFKVLMNDPSTYQPCHVAAMVRLIPRLENAHEPTSALYVEYRWVPKTFICEHPGTSSPDVDVFSYERQVRICEH